MLIGPTIHVSLAPYRLLCKVAFMNNDNFELKLLTTSVLKDICFCIYITDSLIIWSAKYKPTIQYPLEHSSPSNWRRPLRSFLTFRMLYKLWECSTNFQNVLQNFGIYIYILSLKYRNKTYKYMYINVEKYIFIRNISIKRTFICKKT